jgi:phosphatidylglycerol---prolipoprotein diacylglyceryl transferase
MKFPIYVHIGDFKVLLHTLLEPLAFFIGFRYFLFLKRRKGDVITSDNRIWILIGAVFGALLGSRLVGGLEDPLALQKSQYWVIHFYTNKTVLGGLIGGLFGVESVKKIIQEKEASGDLFVYPILLALIIGRIGCFSMGVYEETYGSETTKIIGMNLGDGANRHPVALYEITFLIVLWVLLWLTAKKVKLANGALFKLMMLGYISFRFLLDFIKPHYTYSIGLSAIQITCIIGLCWYTPYLLKPRKFIYTK